MKLDLNKLRNLSFFTAGLMIFTACTDLEETVIDGVEFEVANTEYAVSNANPEDLLASAYSALRGPYQDQARLFCLDEHSTDAVVGPTRGGDWDDNGVWRQLHTQTYAPDHGFNRDTWNDMFSAINQANFVLGANPNPQQEAEARFLRALHYYHVVDLWGSAPYREIGSDPNAAAPVWTRSEATDWIISELNDILGNLPSGDPTIANKNAAHWLLAKMYLNKAVFQAENPAGPYNFSDADMAKVEEHVDAITGVSMAEDYWDNFVPRNTQTSDEIIFVSENIGGIAAGNVRSRWFMGQHYNQTPSGWNGFTTLAEYYDKFDPNDERILKWFPETTEKNGYNVGFQIGQQYGPGGPGVGAALTDRPGNPLVFTKELTLITGGSTLETAGIRGVKYVPDMESGDNVDNDFVIARYGEALLMKAEAMARRGDLAGATAIVQSNFSNESTTNIGSVDALLDVRARELWWEGWRRNDRVRFGKFLSPVQLKDYESDPKYVLFPIPAAALANPNITQNPGY